MAIGTPKAKTAANIWVGMKRLRITHRLSDINSPLIE